MNGPIPIYYQPSGTGELECAVVLVRVLLYKPLVRFTLAAALATSDASKTATISHQYGCGMENPMTGSGEITVHNLLTHTAATYTFEGGIDDAGLAVWDYGDNYRIIQMECDL